MIINKHIIDNKSFIFNSKYYWKIKYLEFENKMKIKKLKNQIRKIGIDKAINLLLASRIKQGFSLDEAKEDLSNSLDEIYKFKRNKTTIVKDAILKAASGSFEAIGQEIKYKDLVKNVSKSTGYSKEYVDDVLFGVLGATEYVKLSDIKV